MGTFPQLKTGAVAQYPAGKILGYSTCVLRFVDGGEQRFRSQPGPLRRWIVRLDLLDENEATAIEEFFVSQQGQLGDFTFTDPWDGTEYVNCSLETDAAVQEYLGRMHCRTTLIVRENRD